MLKQRGNFLFCHFGPRVHAPHLPSFLSPFPVLCMGRRSALLPAKPPQVAGLLPSGDPQEQHGRILVHRGLEITQYDIQVAHVILIGMPAWPP